MKPRHKLVQREICDATFERARAAGLGPLSARVIAGRVSNFGGDFDPVVQPSLRGLAPPDQLPDAVAAARRIAQAVLDGERIGLVTDYDVDGITSHALMLYILTDHFGVSHTNVASLIGHRLHDGYGLSDGLCARIIDAGDIPTVIITADCGSSDEPRIAKLRARGADVIVTDHHSVPAAGPPASAFAVVNPARSDSLFPDPAIAGCMVAWLLMCQVRRALIDRGALSESAPKLSEFLDFVSLGTVADAVSLFSPTNRAVVQSGLAILNRRERPCWRAIARLLGREYEAFEPDDLAFQLGPRINARGRMADPFAALNFLRAGNEDDAMRHLATLDADNIERRVVERRMVEIARRRVERTLGRDDQLVLVYDDDFHAGVQGIVAARLVDAYGRVAAVLSPGRRDGEVSGSLRSVPGVDIAAALRLVDRGNPGLFISFGGHPAAAGVTLAREFVERFEDELRRALRDDLHERRFEPVVLTDGPLDARDISERTVEELRALAPYGRGFEAPVFAGHFVTESTKLVGSEPVHLALSLRHRDRRFRAIWFGALDAPGDPLPVSVGEELSVAYRLEEDRYRGGGAVQLKIVHAVGERE